MGKALVYAVRVNLSVAILCMTRDDFAIDNSTVFTNMTSFHVTESPDGRGEPGCGNIDQMSNTMSAGSHVSRCLIQ